MSEYAPLDAPVREEIPKAPHNKPRKEAKVPLGVFFFFFSSFRLWVAQLHTHTHEREEEKGNRLLLDNSGFFLKEFFFFFG